MDANWNPVKDGLPEVEIGRYLVSVECANKYGDSVFFSDFFNGRFINLNGCSFPGVSETITAWMEIPEPYNGR